MSKNIEQLVKKILQAEKFSSLPIDAEPVAQKKIYMNEARADDLAANVGLKNFTIAHELGHWVLHRHLLGEQSKQIEREADLFAVYLLMPEDLVRAEFAKINSPFTWREVYSLAEKFRVSATAMSIRLSQCELKIFAKFRGRAIFLRQANTTSRNLRR